MQAKMLPAMQINSGESRFEPLNTGIIFRIFEVLDQSD